MKNLKFIAIMACAVFTLASCEKEEIQSPKEGNKVLEQKTSKHIMKINKTGGGGEEEEMIIIRGVTQNTDQGYLENAQVSLFDSTTTNNVGIVYSDSQGFFEFSADTGTYYFEVEASGYQNLQTDYFTFSNDTTDVIFTLNE